MSTIVLKVFGMQKMLTSLAGLAAPPVVRGPAAEPVSTMVRATFELVNAPAVCCPQLRKPGDCVWPAQSVFDVHAIGRQGAAALHGAVVVPVLPAQTVPVAVPPQRRAKELSETFRQKPQNTFV